MGWGFDMSEFKVGEVAVLCYDGEYNGTEVVIQGPEIVKEVFSYGLGRLVRAPVYPVSGIPSHVPYALARHLRKKRPPEEQTTWQAVQSITGWTPQGVPA